jgi:uncharacterized Zn-finger protein
MKKLIFTIAIFAVSVTMVMAQDQCVPYNQTASEITAHSAVLSWDSLTGPTWVRFYPTGTTQYHYKFAHQNNTAMIKFLMEETEYTWDLSTMCDGEWTDFDWPQTFTTLQDTVVCEPTNQQTSNITDHSADVSWEGLDGPTWVRFYPTGTTEYRYRFVHQNNSVTLNWLDDLTEYTWELNTLCNGQWTGFDWPQVFTTLEDTVVCEPTNQVAENITAHSADLSWEGLDGPTWVRFYPTGTTEYHYRFAHQNNSVSLGWLDDLTEYTWELNTLCDGEWTGFGWAQAFTTLEDTVVCEPTNQVAENITAHSADLSWEGLDGPTWVRYYPTGTTDYRYRFAHNNSAVSLHWLQAETEYTWELSTLCNGMWSGFDWAQTFTTLEDTAVCEPTDQTAENITAHSADLTWEGIDGLTWIRYYPTGTTDYRYRFSHFNNIVHLHMLEPETEYTWELNTLCNGMWTGFDWPQTFVTLPDTGGTVNCEPVNQMASNITAHSADLSWEGLEGPTIVRYKKASCPQYHHMVPAGMNNMVSLFNLKDATEYNWQLSTFCDGVWTDFGWEQSFVTLEADGDNGFKTSGVITEIPAISEFNAYPNPVSNQAVVHLTRLLQELINSGLSTFSEVWFTKAKIWPKKD